MTLDDLRRAARAAFPGPWKHYSFGSGTEFIHMKDGEAINEYGKASIGAHMSIRNLECLPYTEKTAERMSHDTAAFIALSRNAVPKLLAFVEAWDKFNALDPYGTEDWSDEQMDAYRVTVAARKKLEEG